MEAVRSWPSVSDHSAVKLSALVIEEFADVVCVCSSPAKCRRRCRVGGRIFEMDLLDPFSHEHLRKLFEVLPHRQTVYRHIRGLLTSPCFRHWTMGLRYYVDYSSIRLYTLAGFIAVYACHASTMYSSASTAKQSTSILTCIKWTLIV